ncbi:hypothetical protein E2C01_094115 [Portunus trituberculatus]|uniref:Uncharacterized protein n=1 Tax=Portunus trituberculatus TaxID=210409 RepID=A0A5B7K288_PORTR|nr:hypothetical protein [Portunus trituberculatus]
MHQGNERSAKGEKPSTLRAGRYQWFFGAFHRVQIHFEIRSDQISKNAQPRRGGDRGERKTCRHEQVGR